MKDENGVKQRLDALEKNVKSIMDSIGFWKSQLQQLEDRVERLEEEVGM
jgi:archaellum component FlaC